MKKYLPHRVKSMTLFAVFFSALLIAQIRSARSGDWSSPLTWDGGVVPEKNNDVVIEALHTVTISGPIERNNGRTTIVNGAFQINPGGSATGQAFTYSSTGSLAFNHGSGIYDIDDTTPFWPATGGPGMVRVNATSGDQNGIRLNSTVNLNRIVSMSLATAAGIYLNNATLTLNGSTQINSGGYFNNTPVYGNGSTLIYNTAGNYDVGNEWTGGGTNTVTAGAGVPNNVTVQNGTQLNIFGARGLAGNFLVQGSAAVALPASAGQDLYVRGNFSVMGNATFNPNNRTLVFCGTGSIQEITSANPLTLHYVRLWAPSGGASVRLNSNLQITAPLEGQVVQFSSDFDRFYLNNRLLTLGTTGKTNTISGPGFFVGTSAGTSDLTLLGKGSVGILKFTATSSLRNLTVNREAGLVGATLGSALSVAGTLYLQAGIIDLYGHTLTIGIAGTVSQGTPAAGNYLIADGDNGGALRKAVDNTFTGFLFPVGDSHTSADGSNYSPINIDINRPTVNPGAYLEVKVYDNKALDSDDNFLSRYWTVKQSGLTNNFKYKADAVYTDADVTGNESSFFNSVYDVSDAAWSQQGKNNVNFNTIAFTAGDLGLEDMHWITAAEKTKKREIIVRGNGIEIAPGDSTPDFFDNTYFGTATAGGFIEKKFVIQNVGSGPLNVGGITMANNAANPGAFTLIPPVFSGSLAAGASAEITARFSASLPVGNKTAVITVNSNDPIKPNYSFTVMGTVNNFITCNGFSILRIQNFENSPAYPPYSYTVTENTAGSAAIIAGGAAYANNDLYDKYQEGQSLQVFNANSTVQFSEVDLTTAVDPYLVFSLAAFGYTLGEGPSPGDFVEVSVSPDNGINWYKQLRLNAGYSSNWNFNLQNPDYTRTYSTGTESVISLGDGSQAGASVRYVISNLPKVSSLLVKIVLKSGADPKIWALDNVIIIDNTSTKTWTGTAWTGVDAAPPTFSQKAVISGNLTTTPATSFSACECEVKPGARLTVSKDSYVEIQGNITNNGQILVESDGNLKQVNDNAVNTGTVTVRRNQTFSAARKEYNFLSSPVANQNMKSIYGNNPANVPFVMVLNESANLFYNATASDYTVKAKGFGVKEPVPAYVDLSGENLPVTTAQFKGPLNNGVITLPLSLTPGKGYHVAGNPYASNIDIMELYQNSTSSLIDPTFRFWDNTVNDIYVQQGGAYQGYSYALYNVLTDTDGFGIAAPGNGTGGPVGIKVPQRIIKVGQGFMVRATGNGAELRFKNSVRKTAGSTNVFFGRNSNRDRYRLQLVKEDGFTMQNGVAYFAAGQADYGMEDTRLPNSSASDALFSYAGDAKVVINGRSTFGEDDVLTLGTRHYKSGTYTIQAVDEEGVFAGGQGIFLKDKVLGIITDLTKGDYSFTSEAGEYTSRFEIVYRAASSLATAPAVKTQLEVYRDAADYVVRSGDKSIEAAEVFDASGKLLLNLKGSGKEVRFQAESLPAGMYVVKISLKDGEQLSKKIRK